MGNLAQLRASCGQFDAVASLLTPFFSTKIMNRPEAPVVLSLRYGLAIALLQLERTVEAVQQLETLLAGEVLLHGPDSPTLITTYWSLATALGKLGELQEGIVYRRQCLRLMVLSGQSGSAAQLQVVLALVEDLWDAGKHAEAETVRAGALQSAGDQNLDAKVVSLFDKLRSIGSQAVD
jgi:hypothetical protein